MWGCPHFDSKWLWGKCVVALTLKLWILAWLKCLYWNGSTFNSIPMLARIDQQKSWLRNVAANDRQNYWQNSCKNLIDNENGSDFELAGFGYQVAGMPKNTCMQKRGRGQSITLNGCSQTTACKWGNLPLKLTLQKWTADPKFEQLCTKK